MKAHYSAVGAALTEWGLAGVASRVCLDGPRSTVGLGRRTGIWRALRIACMFCLLVNSAVDADKGMDEVRAWLDC